MSRSAAYHDDFGLLSGSEANPAYDNLNQMITAAGSSPLTFVINRPLSVTASTTVHANTVLKFEGNGSIVVPSDKTLVINGRVEAPNKQIFSVSGRLDGLEKHGEIPAIWFGTTLNALKQAISLTTGLERVIVLHPGTYTVNGSLKIPRRNTLVVLPGAVMQLSSSPTVTIYGRIEAGDYRIFSGTGTIDGVLRGDYLNNEWFGTGITRTSLSVMASQDFHMVKRGGEVPIVAAGNGCFFCKLDGGRTRPFFKTPSGDLALFNDPGETAEWITNTYTVAYTAPNQFDVQGGDYTGIFEVGRKVKITLGASTSVATITGVTMSGADTRVTVDDTVVDVTISAVQVGILSFTDSCLPGVVKADNCLHLVQQSSGPALGSAAGRLYVLDNGGIDELYYRSDGGIVQMTSNGNLKVNPVELSEQTVDPTAVANTGFLYTKDDSGVTKLYYRDNNGDVTQLVAGGGLNPNILLTEQSSAPATNAGVGALYTKEVNSETVLMFREESSGDEIQLTGNGNVKADWTVPASIQLVLSSSTVTTWTSVDCSAVVPVGTSVVKLQIEFGRPGTDSYSRTCHLRQESGKAEAMYCHEDNMTGYIEGYAEASVTLSSSRTFDVKTTALYSTQGEISLSIIAYR